MACEISAGITLGCKDPISGIKKLYLANFDNVDSIVASNGNITDINMDSGKFFYEFAFPKNTASFTQVQTGSVENHSTFVTQTITAFFPKLDVTKRNIMKILGQTTLAAIVLDNNGTYWYFGETRGLDLTESTGNTGVNLGEQTGFTITLTGSEPDYAQTVDGTLITASPSIVD